ncbi:hypothetical protein RN001_006098 [Aquatica leii]|uniref:DDE Tnp4 domain-containing protein n=1 Tax=Aquatica leii TaxID=1421715 RepID=A0AAN7SJH6_9COLE|nr:hypothetical protein RN001_006098 [Aquatica leii]
MNTNNTMESDSSSRSSETVLLYYNLRKKMWVRPIFVERRDLGEFWTLVPQLKNNLEKFSNYYRMSPTCLQYMLDNITPLSNIGSILQLVNVLLQHLIDLELALIILSAIIEETLDLIYTSLSNIYLKFPTKNVWLRIADEFREKRYFPNCIGALDGKHIRIKKPKHSGSLYFNYKGYYSVVLIFLVDANYNLTVINIGNYGRSSDGGIFYNSRFGQLLNSGELNLPEKVPLDHNTVPLPFVIIADEAFRLSENLLKPFPRRDLNYQKKIFSYRLSHARQMVECTFGILVSKFRIFETSISIAPEKVDTIIKTACLLHNIIRQRDQLDNDAPIFDRKLKFNLSQLQTNLKLRKLDIILFYIFLINCKNRVFCI